MMLVPLLMNYHPKDYREMEAHLKCNKDLLTELGLKYSPSKSTIHVAYGKVGLKLLENSMILPCLNQKRCGGRRAKKHIYVDYQD